MKHFLLQIGSSARLCSLNCMVGGSLPLGKCFHWWRGEGLISENCFLCRFVQTGLLRQEITRLSASKQQELEKQRFLRFAHLSLIFHSTTSRETSALLFVNTSPSQETLLSSPKALPTGEAREKYIGNTSQVQYWVRSGERSCRVLDQSNPVEHLHWFL